MCELIFMDVTIRILVSLVFLALFSDFYTKRKDLYPNFTMGLGLSLIASVIFIVEGYHLFQGYSDLERLPMCLLVIGIWGIAFFYYFLHFSKYSGLPNKTNLTKLAFLLLILNVVVAFGGLFLIIPDDIALLATGSTTTVQGTITFGLTFAFVYQLFKRFRTNPVKVDLVATFILAIGNTTFIFLQNYSFALEIIRS